MVSYANLYLVIGMILTFAFLALPLRRPGADLPDPFPETARPDATENRKLEYETFTHLVSSRFEATTVSGTIFVTASILVLAQAASPEITPWTKIVLAYASICIYALWLFGIFYTNRRIDLLNYARLGQIEGVLGIEVHRLMVRHESVALRLRSWMWGIVMFGLSMIGFCLLL